MADVIKVKGVTGRIKRTYLKNQGNKTSLCSIRRSKQLIHANQVSRLLGSLFS